MESVIHHDGVTKQSVGRHPHATTWELTIIQAHRANQRGGHQHDTRAMGGGLAVSALGCHLQHAGARHQDSTLHTKAASSVSAFEDM